jgi:TonB family protein
MQTLETKSAEAKSPSRTHPSAKTLVIRAIQPPEIFATSFENRRAGGIPRAISSSGNSITRSEASMKLKISALKLATVLSFAIAVAVALTATAQESAPTGGANSRKVHTKVSPAYPALARQMNVAGRVKIEVTIAADGRVVNTKTVGGSPLLVGAATDAVKKWRYEPSSKESTEIVEFDFSDKN